MNKSLGAHVALAELEAMGLTVEDLVAAVGYKPRTRRTDNSYWTLILELIGGRPLDEMTVVVCGVGISRPDLGRSMPRGG